MLQQPKPMTLGGFLRDKGWFAICRNDPRAQRLPAGTSYLSQLLAHDMFMTEHASKAFRPGARAGTKPGSVNLIQTPLMLETIYGRSGVADQALYQQDNPSLFNLFELHPRSGRVDSLVFHRDPTKNWSYPVLADARNFSTPMLAQICFEFMAYHNRLATKFETSPGMTKVDCFGLARATVIRTWHKIIQNEIIDETCLDVLKLRFKRELGDAGLWSNQKYLALGVLRSFHALVRPEYKFKRNKSTLQSIEKVLKDRTRGPLVGAEDVDIDLAALHVQEWQKLWRFDTEMFFDDPSKAPAANRTGFTPSFTFDRSSSEDGSMKPIEALDRRSAEALDTALLLKAPSVQKAISKMIGAMKAAGATFNKNVQKTVPFPIALLAESFYDTTDPGKLGPVGSAIMRRQFRSVLSDADKRLAKIVGKTLPTNHLSPRDQLPSTFLEMTRST